MTGVEIALAIALAGSSIADGRSTTAGLQRCQSYCYEANPLMRGNRLWVMQAGMTTGTIALSHGLKKRTKLWWLPMAAGIGWHAFAANSNRRIPDFRPASVGAK